MVEFRTEAPGSETETDDSGGFGEFEKYIDEYIKNVKQNPEAKLKLAQTLEENGVDPQLLTPLIGEVPQEPDNAQQVQQAQQTQQQMPTTTDTGPDVDVEQLLDFIGQLKDYTGEDTTVGEVEEWVDNNPDLAQTAIDMSF